MNLKEIVAISGVSGLHKIIGRTKTGLILESLNETKKRFPTSIQDKVSVLEDISMYTEEGDMRLADVFVKIHEKGDAPTAKDNAETQRKFLVDVIKLDSERVYDSDIKKLLVWYNALKDIVDFKVLLAEDNAAEADEATDETLKNTENKSEDLENSGEKSKKVTAKKTAAPTKTSTKTATPKATKISSKSTSNTNTYRPKSV
jgi:hypothetical protein